MISLLIVLENLICVSYFLRSKTEYDVNKQYNIK